MLLAGPIKATIQEINATVLIASGSTLVHKNLGSVIIETIALDEAIACLYNEMEHAFLPRA